MRLVIRCVSGFVRPRVVIESCPRVAYLRIRDGGVSCSAKYLLPRGWCCVIMLKQPVRPLGWVVDEPHPHFILYSNIRLT